VIGDAPRTDSGSRSGDPLTAALDAVECIDDSSSGQSVAAALRSTEGTEVGPQRRLTFARPRKAFILARKDFRGFHR
jgi:hypothetical protein